MIVEDDAVISSKIKEALSKWNYHVHIAEDYYDILSEFSSIRPDIVLLDIGLPFYNGYYWCEKIRTISNVPIMFISSKSDDMDIIMAMQFGADDFIAKPISLDVLVAKLNALIRRTYNQNMNTSSMVFNGIQHIASECKITYSENSIELTKTENMIADCLFKANGKIVNKNKIIEKCWQGDEFIDDNTLAVNMTRLRKKLKTIGLDKLIATKKGAGYYLHKQGDDIE